MLGDYLGVAQTTRPTVPAVPIWVDTRSGNPDPFITRAGIAPYADLVLAWEAARESLAQVRLPLFASRLAILTATAKITNRSLLPGRTQTTSLRSGAPGRS